MISGVLTSTVAQFSAIIPTLQAQLMALLALAQMQNQETAYSGTPLEEKQQTISEMFASKGKTLGGNDIQSLSQKLGK